jgi:hypothetical protein
MACCCSCFCRCRCCTAGRTREGSVATARPSALVRGSW